MKNKRILEINEVMDIAKDYFIFWPDNKAMDWFKLIFPHFEKTGFFNFHSDREEMQIRCSISLFAFIYYELCIQTAWHEDKNFSDWEESIFIELRKEYSSILMNDPDEYILKIYRGLNEIGLESVFMWFWKNCEDGASRLVHSQSNNAAQQINSLERIDEQCYKQGLDWVLGGISDLKNYECLPIPF